MFASVTSCLSWNCISNAHWSGPALWYASILLAVPVVLLGTQQLSVLPQKEDIGQLSTVQITLMKERLTEQACDEPRPSRFMLFVWQAPMMFLSYSVVLFLAGFGSIVFSPLAQDQAWNDALKVKCISTNTPVVS
jgi:hypothetical protein